MIAEGERATALPLRSFQEYTRCPDSLLRELVSNGTHLDSIPWPLAGGKLKEVCSHIEALCQAHEEPLQLLDDTIRLLRQEQYIDNSVEQSQTSLSKRLVREAYYRLRPLLPVSYRKHLQRTALRGRQTREFPRWPVDLTVERLVAEIWRRLLEASDHRRFPFIWFWPDGKTSACMMTHDVETSVGRDFCGSLLSMEARFAVVSSFEVVPEQRYEVKATYLDLIREAGCEVCVHGLNHDGRLFSSREIFRDRAERIRQYALEWGAVGFRSPVMYRNLNWMPELGFDYDMSVPNVAHLDPQPGGCCSVMPYFIGQLLELPLTTIQDYSLFHILGQRSTDLWRSQAAKVIAANGLLSFIIHPDYVTENWSSRVYLELLDFITGLRHDANVWLALPNVVSQWWRRRSQLRLVNVGGEWRIEGQGAERARLAFAEMVDGEVRYVLA